MEYLRLPRFRFGSDRLFQPRSCTRSVDPSGRWIVTTVVMRASIDCTSRSLLSCVSLRSATAISKRLPSDARSGPKAWRSSTLNNRRSASVSFAAPLNSISSAGFTISPMFGETSSVRVLLVLGRLSSDNAFPLANDSLKTNIKHMSEARCCVRDSVQHKPPDS